jgi:hypothetical protein
MPEPAATQILETKVVDNGPNAARVELTIADADTLEGATESVAISVKINLKNETRPFVDYQRLALHRAVDLLPMP